MTDTQTTPDMTCDVAVIGAGTAGIVAERTAREDGARTLLIDPAFAGTTCATVGCMPSKLLIAAADAAHAVHSAGTFGIDAQGTVDAARVFARVRRHRDRFVDGVQEGFDALPDGVAIKARARFASPTRLHLDDGRMIEAKAIVIAAGASPALPGMLNDVRDHVLTNESLFELKDFPESLGVIGAGPLGLELAQALHRLGVHIEVFDMGDTVAGLSERKVSDRLAGELRQSFPLRLGVEITATPENDQIRLDWTGAEQGTRRFSHILVAAGRPPNLDGLELGNADLPLDDHGIPHFDPNTMQCGQSAIFIAGDANHARPVLHEAQAEGAIAGRNAAAFPDVKGCNRKVSMAVTFTRPQAAMIGDVPDDDDHLMGDAEYSDQGRATVEARGAGLVRLFARQDGHLTAAALCAPDGEHLAHLLAWAIQTGMSAADLLDCPFYHPTLEEGLRDALRAICRDAGTPTSRGEDDGPVPGERGHCD